MTLTGYHAEAKPVATCPADFLAYYRRQLVGAGWEETWSASGACDSFPDGEQFGYKKPMLYFQFGVINTREGYVAFVEYAEHN